MIPVNRPVRPRRRSAATKKRETVAPPTGKLIPLGQRPLPETRQKQLLKIIRRRADDVNAQRFLADAAKAIDFFRVVHAHESGALLDSQIRRELRDLNKQLKRTLDLLGAISNQAWGQLDFALQALHHPEQPYARWIVDRLPREIENHATEPLTPHAPAGNRPETLNATVEGLRTLVTALDELQKHLKPSRGGKSLAAAPRFLGNELAKFLHHRLQIKVTAYQYGIFEQVYRACYSEALGLPVGADYKGNVLNYLRAAILVIKPPQK